MDDLLFTGALALFGNISGAEALLFLFSAAIVLKSLIEEVFGSFGSIHLEVRLPERVPERELNILLIIWDIKILFYY
jgi:hypothetical protein